MNDGHKLNDALGAFYGGDTLYFNPLNPKIKYTEGVKFFLDNAGHGAYWLLNILITEPAILRAQRDLGIVFVRLKVVSSQANLVVNAGRGCAALFSQHFRVTDCPECPKTDDNPNAEWLFYFENDTIMLPGER